MDVALTVEPRKQVGVVWDTETVFQKQPKGTLIAYATSECWKRTTEIGQILTKLFTGGLSPKLLGGPVMIFEATANSARSGLYDFFTMLAMISINLGIFNLLPLPVLDGGQLTIIGIEALRGKEVSPQILERFQAAGVFFILGLMLFVTYNDILRAVGRILP
jgi:regulator of sigma E protease